MEDDEDSVTGPAEGLMRVEEPPPPSVRMGAVVSMYTGAENAGAREEGAFSSAPTADPVREPTRARRLFEPTREPEPPPPSPPNRGLEPELIRGLELTSRGLEPCLRGLDPCILIGRGRNLAKGAKKPDEEESEKEAPQRWQA